MPRKSNRGGVRTGVIGKTYANRTDLRPTQPIKAVPGQAYGAAKAQTDAQKIVPLPNAQAPIAPPSQAPMPMPGETPFDAPTTRPNEPLTHGSPSGPGPGPEVLMMNDGGAQNVELQLRAWYAKNPNPDLADLIDEWQSRND